MNGGITLEKLKVVIEAYTKPYKEEINKVRQETEKVTKQVEHQTAKIQNSYSRVASAIGKVVSIAALASFGKSCIELGSDLTEVQNVVDVTFGDMSEQVNTFAQNAITQFGLSELAAKEYMGTYGSMAKSYGFDSRQVYELSAAITGLTGDLASFRNLSTDEAYTKLKSIFTGETESLKDLGVVITQTALDQYALNNGFGKTTAKMTEQEKVMLRYQFVMSALSDASGDFARTSHSWANQVKILQLQFESLKATIGQGLINALTPVIGAVNTLLAKLQTLAAYFKAFTVALFGDANGEDSALGSAAGASGDIANNMGSAAQAAKKLKEYTLGIDELNIINPSDDSGASSGGIPDFGSLSGTLLSGVEISPDALKSLEDLTNIVEHLKETAQPAREALERLREEGLNKLDSFSWKALQDFWDYFLKPLGSWTLGTGFPRFVDITNDFLTNIHWDDINNALRGFWQVLEPFAEDVGEGLLDFYRGLLNIGADFINLVVPGGLRALSGALETIDADEAKAIGSALGIISVAIPGLSIAEKVAPGVKTLGEALKMLPGINIAHLITASGLIGTPAFDLIGVQIIDTISKFIEEHAGEAVVNAIGHGLVIAVGAGIGMMIAGPLGLFAGGFAAAVLDALANVDWSDNVWEKVCETIFNFDTANALAEQADQFIRDAFDTEGFFDCGANMIAGIAAGFTAGFAYLIEPITDFFAFVIGKICSLFGIHSPASAMKPYGRYILQGIIQGFRDTFDEWTASLNDWYSGRIAPWFTAQRWLELYDTIKTSMRTKWNETTEQWSGDISFWWQSNVSPWFTAEKWLSIMSGIPIAFGNIFKEAVNAGVAQLNKLIDWINEKLCFDFDGLEIAGQEIIPSFSVQLFKIPHVPELADGGIINSGQLFVANEAGPELVARYGNRSGVINNDQIVSAVSEGVATAVANVMTAFSGDSDDKKPIEVVVNLDGRTISKAVQKADKRSGFRFRTT